MTIELGQIGKRPLRQLRETHLQVYPRDSIVCHLVHGREVKGEVLVHLLRQFHVHVRVNLVPRVLHPLQAASEHFVVASEQGFRVLRREGVGQAFAGLLEQFVGEREVGDQVKVLALVADLPIGLGWVGVSLSKFERV